LEHFDVLGVGLGPFNLSPAALTEPLTEMNARFLKVRPSFQWHNGIMAAGSWRRGSFLKDFVTLIDPSGPFSFLDFPVAEDRLNRFLIAHGYTWSRQEFERSLSSQGTAWIPSFAAARVTGDQREDGRW
jgi:lysine N6-hydroxylase